MYSLNKSKFLLEPELRLLNETLSKFKDRDPRNVLLIELALRTGARAQELLNIQTSDLDPHEETVLIKGLKGSMDREIPLPSALFGRLLSFSKGCDGLVFPISYNYFRYIWTLYRPIQKKLHCLRHTFAIELYKRTRDLRLVQQALGHKSISNTMVYANYIYSTTELRKVLIR